MLAAPNAFAQVGVIAAGGLLGWWFLREGDTRPEDSGSVPVGRVLAISALAVFGILLIGLPLARQVVTSEVLDIFDSFFRTGSLVFGGGHVVLPLLQNEVVPPGWVTTDTFIAGYGAAQAIPGPLFTLSAYLGASIDFMPARWLGGLLTLDAIFLPSFLLVAGVLPFWDRLRSIQRFRHALMGINAAVVGLLLAALYDPVWTSAILAPADFGLAVAAFGLLAVWKWPPWAVVILSAGTAEALTYI